MDIRFKFLIPVREMQYPIIITLYDTLSMDQYIYISIFYKYNTTIYNFKERAYLLHIYK